MVIHQDVDLYASNLDAGTGVKHRFSPSRRGWLQVVDGDVSANGQLLSAGDGLAIQEVELLEIEAASESEFLLFDIR